MVDGYFALIPRKSPSSAQLQQTRIVAHRGAHNNAQGIIENTMHAFDLAQKAGCWGIEFDVHRTADNILVVNHDPTLTRLWGHDRAIADLNFAELRHLVPQVPSLKEVILQFKTMHLFIELKTAVPQDLLMRELEGLSPGIDYHLLTLEPQLFTDLTVFPLHVLLLVPVHNNVQQFCDLSIRKHYGGVLGSYLLLTKKRIFNLKKAKQLYGVGFVNSKNGLYRELNRGVTWIFTNQAEKLRHFLTKT